VSFSRYADMSRLFHYFFSGYYSAFVREHEQYKEKIYTVFSGGDDLCILGAWDAVLAFAADFHRRLSRLTNKNPSVTLSGGIVLASPSLPVRVIAREAEEALEAAKRRRGQDGGIIKNGITCFNTTVSWEEFEQALEDGRRMAAGMEAGTLTSGVVYRMIDFANRAKAARGGPDGRANLRDLVWVSNFRYMITRNIKDPEIRKWFAGFGTTDRIEKSRIAVSYALYAQRNRKEE